MPEEVMLYADQTLVMRVLINLISNGIYYSKVKKTNKDTNPNQNGNEINQDDAYTSDVDDFQTNQENYVSIDIEETTHQVFCTVSDNGIGIPKEHQDKIWNRFYQVDPSRSKLLRGGSSGLGLAMVKWIVEVHGGKITLKSDKGKGSTFKVVLPKER